MAKIWFIDAKKNKKKNTVLSFQNLIFNLQKFWDKQGCIILQPYDLEVGAGTFHPATTLRSLGPNPGKQLTFNLKKTNRWKIRKKSKPTTTLLSISGYNKTISKRY